MAVNFDRIVPFYDLLANMVYGDSIRMSQVYFLNRIPSGAKVLILGGGSGWVLHELAKVNKFLRIDYVEASKKMLIKAKRQKDLGFKEINFIHGTEKILSSKKYDFVLTPFVLDVFPEDELEAAVLRVKRLLVKNGLWLCVDFNVNDKSLKAKILSFLMIRFFRVVSGLKTTSLFDYFDEIYKAGCTPIAAKCFYGKFIKSQLFKVR